MPTKGELNIIYSYISIRVALHHTENKISNNVQMVHMDAVQLLTNSFLIRWVGCGAVERKINYGFAECGKCSIQEHLSAL